MAPNEKVAEPTWTCKPSDDAGSWFYQATPGDPAFGQPHSLEEPSRRAVEEVRLGGVVVEHAVAEHEQQLPGLPRREHVMARGALDVLVVDDDGRARLDDLALAEVSQGEHAAAATAATKPDSRRVLRLDHVSPSQ